MAELFAVCIALVGLVVGMVIGSMTTRKNSDYYDVEKLKREVEELKLQCRNQAALDKEIINYVSELVREYGKKGQRP